MPPRHRQIHRPAGRRKDRHGRVEQRSHSEYRQPRPGVQRPAQQPEDKDTREFGCRYCRGDIQATDPNTDDNLTYKLTGDAALFKITSEDEVTDGQDERGQITVKTDDTLDYEDKNTYMVTVTATDPNGLSDTIDVTIEVTDVDEARRS